MNRRTFLKITGATTLAASAGSTFNFFSSAAQSRSRVAIVQSHALMGGAAPDSKIIDAMLDHAVRNALRAHDAVSAWRAVAGPNDVVAIKVNSLGGSVAQRKTIVNAIANRLIESGVPEKHIIIYDRSDRDLRKSGFDLNTSRKGIRCYGNDTAGFAEAVTINDTRFRLSNILAKECTVLINVPALKTHPRCGVSSASKTITAPSTTPLSFMRMGAIPI
jgi:hypothetical protein